MLAASPSLSKKLVKIKWDMSRRLYPLLRKDNILLLAGGGVETVIGLYTLSGERSFLEIVWSGAGDISSPNNIRGFDGINAGAPARAGPDWEQLDRILVWAHWPSGPLRIFCGDARHLIIYLEIRCTSNFQKCHFLVGYIFEFAHHNSFLGSMLKSSNIWRVLEFGSFRGLLYINFPQ